MHIDSKRCVEVQILKKAEKGGLFNRIEGGDAN